jgi:hypothetical protein
MSGAMSGATVRADVPHAACRIAHAPLTTIQTCLLRSMESAEADLRGGNRLVCERGIGATEAVVRLCLAGDRGASRTGSSVIVVPHITASQWAERMGAYGPEASTTFVGTACEVHALAVACRGRVRPPALIAVTDKVFGALACRLGDIFHEGDSALFSRVVLDDMPALSVKFVPPDVTATWWWACMGPDPPREYRRSLPEPIRDLMSAPEAELSGRTVWCDDDRVMRGAERPEDMFRHGDDEEAVQRVVDAARPINTSDTARLVAASADVDPRGAAGLIGCVPVNNPAWRGWRDDGDRCCPVCLSGPEEALENAPETLRVRTRCCGREFCAVCMAKTVVSRSDQGMLPSCPNCRDLFGGCLETCDAVLVTRDPQIPGAVVDTRPHGTGALRLFDDIVCDAVSGAIRDPSARVIVVATKSGISALSLNPRFLMACLAPPSSGFETLSGNAGAVAAALARHREGRRRVLCIPSDGRGLAGIRMPWVTHICLLDCYGLAKHWIRRTAASPIDRSLLRIRGGSEVRKRRVVVHRIVPARFLVGRRVSARDL